MPFWQLTLPASADTEDALTNFLWEQGALGVVEEEAPGVPPRLRAFFAESMSSTRLLAAVQDYQASLRSLGFAVESHGHRDRAAAGRGLGERLAAVVPGPRGRPAPPRAAAVDRAARARADRSA